jgi:hypothetical protein
MATKPTNGEATPGTVPSGTTGLSAQAELNALLKKKFPGDERERTYLQLLLEGQAKAAIRGNVEAAKLLLRHARLAEAGRTRRPKKRPRLKAL